MDWLKRLIGKKGIKDERHHQQSNAYDRIGGEKTIRAIAKQFYQQMQTNSETKALLDIHRAPISESEQKLFEFLSGWLGGPQLYQQKHGHPALRAWHMPFKVDETMRDQWLTCMKAAIELEVKDPQHQQAIYSAIATLADHMRNQ